MCLVYSSIDISKIEEDSLKHEAEALKSQLETVEKLNDNLRLVDSCLSALTLILSFVAVYRLTWTRH